MVSIRWYLGSLKGYLGGAGLPPCFIAPLSNSLLSPLGKGAQANRDLEGLTSGSFNMPADPVLETCPFVPPS